VFLSPTTLHEKTLLPDVHPETVTLRGRRSDQPITAGQTAASTSYGPLR
jgi:hypothetical protein